MDKVRVGIVGCGLRACFHGGCVFRDCKEEVTIAGVCDPVPERRERASCMYGDEFGYRIPAFADMADMCSAVKTDAVYIATPNDTHADLAIQAFSLELDVLCEKPMDINLQQCDRMITKAGAAGRILGLAMQMHYRARYHKVRELLEDGILGEPAMVWCTEYRPPFKGEKDWVWRKERSGGAIVEKNCHHYDILDLWVDSAPTTVYATGNILKHRTGGGVESNIIDNAWVINDYENGARGMVGICFLASWEQGHYREFGVQGTKGRVFFSSKDGEVLHVQLDSGDRREYTINREIHGGLFRDFLNCVRTRSGPLVSPERGRRSLLVPLAAEKAIAEKRIVSVSELE